jgi:ABC-type transport system substrate-binding protein
LLDYGEGTDIMPWLAEKLPAVSANGCTYTFHLKKGTYFSNGRELEAKDFVYSLERVLDPRTKSPGESYFRNIRGAAAFQRARADGVEAAHVEGLQTLDRYTLQIELEQAEPAFLNVLCMPFAYAVPREAVERPGADFGREPVGTGPFVLAEWTRGLRLRCERRPGDPLAKRQALDAVEFMIGGDELTHSPTR